MTVPKLPGPRKPKRRVEWDGRSYKVRDDGVNIPDLAAMPRDAAVDWLARNTEAMGRGERPRNRRPRVMGALGNSEGR